MHYGRYGSDAGRQELGTLFLGSHDLVRGYDYYSYEAADCTGGASSFTGCASLDNLFGTRLAVANVELRLPLIGNDRIGLINFAFLPTELAAFVDGGIAWASDDDPTFGGIGAREPIFSVGLSARFNLFGALIAETYYAIPFQRDTGGRFGFQFTPGW
jgi:outer membrane protein assembly factor BamA